MAKKATDVVGELKTLLEQGKLVFGADRAVKGLKQGTLRKVFLSKNCSPVLRLLTCFGQIRQRCPKLDILKKIRN